MKKSISSIVFGLFLIFFMLLNGCAITYLTGGAEEVIERNSTTDMCLELVNVLPRVSRNSSGKYYYDRCLFRVPGANTFIWAYCPKYALESGKMELGQSYMVHAKFNGDYGSAIAPNEGFFFNPDGEVISCKK